MALVLALRSLCLSTAALYPSLQQIYTPSAWRPKALLARCGHERSRRWCLTCTHLLLRLALLVLVQVLPLLVALPADAPAAAPRLMQLLRLLQAPHPHTRLP